MPVWDDLVGQERVAAQLDAAARDADALVTATAAKAPPPEASKMTHAWLFTGPPGAGRATAARAFAAALQCVSPDRALGGSPAADSATAVTRASSARTPTWRSSVRICSPSA